MKSSLSPENGILLDIDDTLVDTSVACAHEAWEITPVPKFFSPEDVLATYGLPEQVPEWQTTECSLVLQKLLKDVDFLAKIPEIPGARQAVHTLSTFFPITGYLTSRLPFAFDVTTEWLASHGFPQAPVIYRFPDTTDRDWKVRYLEKNLPESVGIVDNELYVPEETSYKGKLIELIRFRLMSPFDERKVICHTWEEVINYWSRT